MGRTHGIRLTMLSLLFLGMALNPSALGELLSLVGMDVRTARLAGSRLAVVSALSGAGLLLLGITSFARSSRIRKTAEATAEALLLLPAASGARAHVLDGVGAVMTADVDGLRIEVVVEPERGGIAWLRSRCPAGQVLSIWPRGLADAGDGDPAASGRAWECVSSGRLTGISDLDDALNRLFEEGEASQVEHTRRGIEVRMSNAPASTLLGRLSLAVSVASGLARINR